MMTGFWFFCYVIFTIYGIVSALMNPSEVDKKPLDKDTRIVATILTSAMLSLAFLLAYHAGVYNYITGYEGTPFWFSVWFSLTAVAMIYNIFRKGVITILTTGISIFLLFQINAFAQLGNMIQ